MKHTQEKWFVRKSEPTSHRKIYSVMFQGKRRELMIARCGGNEEEATLIASAPEMLETLKWIGESEVSILPNQDYKQAVNGWVAKAGKMAREAIAKAEGK